jgi:hypothetical protein
MSDRLDKIVEVTVVFEDQFGGRTNGAIYLGRPYPDEGGWSCPVGLVGLDLRLPDISGINSLQALALALGLIHARLSSWFERGGKVFICRDDGSVFEKPFSLSDYFPS